MSKEKKEDQKPTPAPPPETPSVEPGPRIPPPKSQLVTEGIEYPSIFRKKTPKDK